MNMIRHHHRHSEAIFSLVVMYTASQDDVAGPVWQDEAKLGAERNKMRRIVALHVRQIATIELHRQILPRASEGK